jgi:hypothetical protein
MEKNWRKSQRSKADGNCVEAGSWRKSGFSAAGNCVETGYGPGVVGVRDTKDKGAGPVLEFAPSTWTAFVSGLK